ncbi:MAG: YgaP family membrane protein [Chitinophagaceae bacterium]
MGNTDRIIRVIVALAVIILYLTHQISGLTALILGIIAGILILTSFLSFCPLYWPFRINTKKRSSPTP